MKNIDNDIKNRSFKRVYLIFGEEKYLTMEYECKLKNAVVPKTAELMNTAVFDSVSEIENIRSAVETLPFFSDYRLVVVKDSGLFKQGKKDLTDKMVEIVKNIPETTVMIFAGDEVDKRNSLYKAVKKYGYACEIKNLKDNELIKWVEKQSDGKVKGSVASYFVQNVGNSMEALKAELDKLIIYSKGQNINTKLIDDICTKSPEANVFEMVDAIGNKRPDKALEIYNNMLVERQSSVMILSMVARQFKMILQCKYLMKKNYTKDQISYELSQRSFTVDKYMKQSRNFTISKLMDAVRECAELDVRFKQGLISSDLGVEMIIIKYSV